MQGYNGRWQNERRNYEKRTRVQIEKKKQIPEKIEYGNKRKIREREREKNINTHSVHVGLGKKRKKKKRDLGLNWKWWKRKIRAPPPCWIIPSVTTRFFFSFFFSFVFSFFFILKVCIYRPFIHSQR